MTIETQGSRLDSIQVLRGVAAIMVVVFHTQTQLARMGHDQFSFPGLASGVDIFFVISGFIMLVSTANAPDRTAGEFLLDRIIRIVPLYWAVTIGVTLLALFAPRLLQSTVLEPVHLAMSFLFIAAPNPSTGGYEPFVVAGWTLNLEMFFYLLFAAAIAMSHGNARLRGTAITIFIGIAAALPFLAPAAPGEILFYGDSIILEFLFGVWLGAIYRGQAYRGGRQWLLAGMAGFVLLAVGSIYFGDVPRAWRSGPAAALIVAAAAFAGPMRTRASWLGDISYSVYLTHGITLSAVAQIWRRIGLAALPPIAFIVVSVAVCIVVGGLVWRWIERPLTRLAKRILRPAPRRHGMLVGT